MKYYTIENSKKSIFKTFAIYYICMLVFTAVRIIGASGGFPDGIAGEIVSSIVIQIIILFALPMTLYCLWLRVTPKQVFKTCNYYRCNYKVILLSFAVGIFCFVINIAVSSLFNGILTFTGYNFYKFGSGSTGDMTIGTFILELVTVCFLPAMCEEFIHRGIVLQGTKHFGFKKAILFSSILFALLHFNIQQCAYAFVVGLILGFVAVVSKNIWPSVIIHFTNNALSTYLSYASVKGWFLGDTFDKLQLALGSGNSVGIFIGGVIILLVVIFLLALSIWGLYNQSMLKKVYRAIDRVYDSKSEIVKSSPVIIDKNDTIKDVIENCTLLNLDYKKMDNPIDAVMPKEKSRYRSTAKDTIFFWASIALGSAVTFFTYVWGLF